MPFRHGNSLFSKSKTRALHEEALYGRQSIGNKKLHRGGVTPILLRYVGQLKVLHDLHDTIFPHRPGGVRRRRLLIVCTGRQYLPLSIGKHPRERWPAS